MTVFGPDVSSYQAGVDLTKIPDVSFVIAKVSEGTYYTDGEYGRFRTQAHTLDVPFVWYHLPSTAPAADQVSYILARVSDPSLPGMLDCEPSGDLPGVTWPQILDMIHESLARGLNLRLIYLPHWYWLEIGSPDLSQLEGLGLHLVSSDYEGGYSGTGVGWIGYGGADPLIWQYTNDQGGLDFNAYRGTVNELRSIFAPRQGDDMAVTFASGQVNAGLAGDGTGAKTVICPPPANTGANWRDVWVSFGADFGTAVLRVAGYVHGQGWKIFPTVSVPANGDRINPFGGPTPTGLQKVSVTRLPGSENVPVGWLVEAKSA